MADFWAELGAWFSAFGDKYFVRAFFWDFGARFLEYLRQLLPYVILGTLLGELLKYTSWTKLIFRFTKRYRRLAVLGAAVLGILSPLCTYGTVPVLITLYHGGVSLGPLIAFLAASSMMNPQLFVMTVGGLGWTVALWRLLFVFLFSMLCGLGTLLLPQNFVVRPSVAGERGSEEEILNRPKKTFAWKSYLLGSGKSLLFVGKMMCIGILIAAFVDQLPLSLFFGEVDTATPLGILAAALVGIPVYACGGGTIPLIASLMGQGMSLGSALAFLTVGPATRITSLAAIATIFRKRFLAVYVRVLLAFSVAAGMLVI
ncbi:MAG: permease [Clostridiales bacterium]|nr:permease [Clostridiales bacterium]